MKQAVAGGAGLSCVLWFTHPPWLWAVMGEDQTALRLRPCRSGQPRGRQVLTGGGSHGGGRRRQAAPPLAATATRPSCH